MLSFVAFLHRLTGTKKSGEFGEELCTARSVGDEGYLPGEPEPNDASSVVTADGSIACSG